jgi:GAG-pre-integrase domain
LLPRPPRRPYFPYSPQSFGPPEVCQICSKRGNVAKDYWYRYDNRYPSSQPQVYTAQPISSPTTSEWCIDFGATHHITSDLNNLSNFIPYDGQDSLHIGNGTDMHILHLDSSNLNIANHSLALQNVLHVPGFTKNILSLSKLIEDNSILIEFSSHGCFIKDHHTLVPLLQVKFHNGLYLLHSSSFSPQALLGEKVSADLWHARLDHPSSSTTLHLLNKYNLSCSTHNFSFCQHCSMAKSHNLPFNSSLSSSTSPLKIVHSDLWGPSPVMS